MGRRKIMVTRGALIGCVLWLYTVTTVTSAMAASPPADRPTITITSPRNGAVLHGSSLTVQVAVSHFKLVKPVLLQPPLWKTIPLLKGNQGHIHYLLDGKLLLLSGVVVQTSHTWTGVAPGPHTVTAYLATSQHAAFPGVPWQTVHVTVLPPVGSAPSSHVTVRPLLRILGVQTHSERQSTTVTVRVAVSHFKLVKPLLLPPAAWNTIPVLSGNQGHIHYLLDGRLLLGHDVVAGIVHPWNNVSPGPHTITAYLATSRHQIFPGSPLVQAAIYLPPGHGPHRATRLRVVTLLPRTGGGSNDSGGSPDPTTLLGWLVLAALGLASRLTTARR